MNPPRLVIDTNVLLSALLFSSGSLTWLRRAWQAKTIRPLVSRETTMELIRVLAYPKFRLTEDEREDVTGDKDLLAVAATFSVPIVTPASLREILETSFDLTSRGRSVPQ